MLEKPVDKGGLLSLLSDMIPFKLPERFGPITLGAAEMIAQSRSEYFAVLGSFMRVFIPFITEHTKVDDRPQSSNERLEGRNGTENELEKNEIVQSSDSESEFQR